jgi:phage/plasmid-like protein (TIGR03299 family)
MSADVEKMFSVRQSVWWQGTSEDHGQATILSDHPTWAEARVLAGLDWDPQAEDLYRPADLVAMREQFSKIIFDAEMTAQEQIDAMMAAAEGAQKIVSGWKHVGRSDTDATLACTQDTYSLITNGDFGEIFEAVLGQDNVKFETGGSLEGGRKVWMLALLDEPIQLPGDASLTYPYLALMSRHDAMGGTVLRPTNVRIVCRNTFNMSELDSEGKGVRRGDNGTFTFVHRGDWRQRFEQARTAVGMAREQAQAYQALAADLLVIKTSKTVTAKFVNTFIPAPPAGMASDRVLANVEASRDKLREIIASSTVAGAGIGGTAYGLVQAAGEYLDHARQARTWETKLNRTLLTPETLKGKAVKIVRELVSA